MCLQPITAWLVVSNAKGEADKKLLLTFQIISGKKKSNITRNRAVPHLQATRELDWKHDIYDTVRRPTRRKRERRRGGEGGGKYTEAMGLVLTKGYDSMHFTSDSPLAVELIFANDLVPRSKVT